MRADERTASDPELDAVIGDLRVLRAKGLSRVRGLGTSVLDRCVATITGRPPADLDMHHYETALREAVVQMGDGAAAEIAAVLFGIAPHVRGLHPIELRKRAAEATYDRPVDAPTVDTFRKTHEPRVLAALASALLTATAPITLGAERAMPRERTPTSATLAITIDGWRRRDLPVLVIGGDPPGRIRELTWAEFGVGIDTIRSQIRDYGTSLDIDLAIGINEGGLLMATLLASASFQRCAIAYIRTVRRGSRVVIDPHHAPVSHLLESANAAILCDFEVKTAPIVGLVTRHLRDQGLRAEATLYFATMGALAASDPHPPHADHLHDIGTLPCRAVLTSAQLADIFVGYLMANPGIDPPLGLR